MKHVVTVAATILCGIGAATVAYATPVTYTEQLTGTGSLGGTAFTNASVTIQLVGDTATVSASPVPNDFGTATVDVSGVGSATFTDAQMWAFDNQSLSVAGISDITKNLLIVDTSNGAFASYDLLSSIGPLSGTAGLNSGAAFPTTVGDFVLTSIARNTSSFSADVAAAAVPEPATLTLTAIGLAAAIRRRRGSRANA